MVYYCTGKKYVRKITIYSTVFHSGTFNKHHPGTNPRLRRKKWIAPDQTGAMAEKSEPAKSAASSSASRMCSHPASWHPRTNKDKTWRAITWRANRIYYLYSKLFIQNKGYSLIRL